MMTTIAYRNGIVAADRRITNDQFIFKPIATKIVKLEHSLATRIIGRVGDVSATQPWWEWVINGKHGADKPDENDEGGYVIEFKKDVATVTVTVFDVEKGTSWTLPLEGDDYIAYGSGDNYAHGAMAHGASAYEAVLAASKHDTATGNVIDTLSFKQLADDETYEHGRH